MFKFIKVEITNFMSIKESTLDLADRGLVLIEGKNSTNDTFISNGSGKSSLINAITYSIYGQTSYGLKADDVINRSTGKNMKVVMHFELDGLPYRIERYRKHSKEKNKVKLFKEDHDLTGKSNKDTEATILELFGIDYLTYMNSIVQGQGETEIFSKATDKGKKEILENVTNISIYKKAQDIAKEKLKDVQSGIQEIDNRINEKERDIEFIKHKRDTEKQQYTYTTQQIAQTESGIQDLNNQKNALAEPINEKQQLESLNNLTAPEYPTEPLEVDAIRKDCLEKMSALSTEISERDTNEVGNIDEAIDNIEASLKMYYTKDAEIKAYINTMKMDISRDENALSKLDTSTECRLCGQPLDAEHIQKEHLALTKRIEASNEIVTTQTKMYNETFLPMLDNVKQSLEDEKSKKRDLEESLELEYKNRTNMLVADRDNQIEAVKAESVAEYKRLLELYNKQLEEKTRLENVVSTYTQNVSAIDARLEERNSQLESLKAIPKPNTYEEDINTLEAKIKELYTTKLALTDNVHNHEDVINKVFSNQGIRSVVLDLVTPYLNERANEYMNVLSGSDIEILFKTQVENKDGTMADKFDLEIVNRSGGETYKSNSEGEKRRIDMAISFAIQDLVMSKTELQTNIAVYDECFEGLDEVGCENVIALLKDRQQRIGSIFVITHNEHLKTLFDKVITVEKKDGISYVHD